MNEFLNNLIPLIEKLKDSDNSIVVEVEISILYNNHINELRKNISTDLCSIARNLLLISFMEIEGKISPEMSKMIYNEYIMLSSVIQKLNMDHEDI